jgi:hypothetical protein
MSVITFAALIVVADKAFTGSAEVEAVLVSVPTAWDGLWNKPSDRLCDEALIVGFLELEDFHCIHVGNHANTFLVLSIAPTPYSDGRASSPRRIPSYILVVTG